MGLLLCFCEVKVGVEPEGKGLGGFVNISLGHWGGWISIAMATFVG